MPQLYVPHFYAPGGKPPLGSRINWEDPLAKGLVASFLLNENGGNYITNLVDGKSYAKGGTTAVWRTTQKGVAIYNSTAFYDITDINLINLPTTQNISFAIGFIPAYALTANKSVLTWDGTDDIVFYPNDNAVSGKYPYRLYWRDCGGHLITEPLGPDLNGVYNVAVFTATPGLQLMYRDGILVGSGANSLAGSGPFTNLWLGKSASDYAQGDILFLHIWNRPLVASEAMAIYLDPYQFIEPVIAPWMMYQDAPSGLLIPVADHYYRQF
jgi:hypothetical protein